MSPILDGYCALGHQKGLNFVQSDYLEQVGEVLLGIFLVGGQFVQS